MRTKVSITLSIDLDVKRKVMPIIQNKLNTSVSAYVNEKFVELIESNKPQLANIFEKELKC